MHRSDWHIVNLGINNVPETVIKLPKDRVYDISVKIGAGSVYLADGEYKNVNFQSFAARVINIIATPIAAITIPIIRLFITVFIPHAPFRL